MSAMQFDSKSLRAAQLVPDLLSALKSRTENSNSDPRIRDAVGYLETWDFHCEPDSVATTIFDVFFTYWRRTVAEERFDAKTISLMSKGVEGCAGRLLQADPVGWFRQDDRQEKIARAMSDALSMLAERFGAEMSQWSWGRLHRMPLKHVLSGCGDLAELLDHGGAGVRGDMLTVCNSGCGEDWEASSGAGYRLISDLSTTPPRLFAVDAQSQSGHPGSPHYDDQFDQWLEGNYHDIPLCRNEASPQATDCLTLEPRL